MLDQAWVTTKLFLALDLYSGIPLLCHMPFLFFGFFLLTYPSLFCRNDIFVFLLSTRAGGLGINLTAADTVSHESQYIGYVDLLL